MATLQYEDIVEKIHKEKGISIDEINAKVKDKLNQLSDLISKEGAAHIVANELGVKMYDSASQARRVKLNELNPMHKNVEVLVKVTRVWEVRSFKTATREGRVANLSIADETGFSRLVLWDENHIKEIVDGNIKEGDILKVTNGYIKENNGRFEVHLGNAGKLEVNPKGETLENVRVGSSPVEAQRKLIKDLVEDENATIVGTIVQIFEPRFYDSCPECRKKVTLGELGNTCPTHGQVEPVLQAILNIVFDDGTDNIRVVCFRENINKVLDLDDVSVLKDNPDKFREVQRNVAGRQLKITGRVTKNTFFDRLEMLANSVEDADPKKLAVELEKQI